MKNKVNIIFIISILGAIISGSLYSFFYVKLMNDEKSAILLQNKFIENESVLKDLDKIERNLNVTLNESEKINILFVQPDAVVIFIQKVEDIFKQTGVAGEVASVSEEKLSTLDAGDQKRILTVLSAEGDWNDLTKLLGLLEKLPYRSTIDSMTMTNNKKETKSEDSESTVLTKKWTMKVRMFVGLTPVINLIPKTEDLELTETNDEE